MREHGALHLAPHRISRSERSERREMRSTNIRGASAASDENASPLMHCISTSRRSLPDQRRRSVSATGRADARKPATSVWRSGSSGPRGSRASPASRTWPPARGPPGLPAPNCAVRSRPVPKWNSYRSDCAWSAIELATRFGQELQCVAARTAARCWRSVC